MTTASKANRDTYKRRIAEREAKAKAKAEAPQLSKADLAAMSYPEISDAYKAGKFRDLLSGRDTALAEQTAAAAAAVTREAE